MDWFCFLYFIFLSFFLAFYMDKKDQKHILNVERRQLKSRGEREAKKNAEITRRHEGIPGDVIKTSLVAEKHIIKNK